MVLTPPFIFSCTVVHRNSRKRKIDLSIVRRPDGSIDVRVRQEVRDRAGSLFDTDTACIVCGVAGRTQAQAGRTQAETGRT